MAGVAPESEAAGTRAWERPTMQDRSYHQFCPTAAACAMIEPRWTMLVLCEVANGSSRFSDIQRGVPGMSPSLLSRRLGEMVGNGLLRREHVVETGHWRYFATESGRELVPLIREIGAWAHRNLDPDLTLDQLDDKLLMWNIRRLVRTVNFPDRRVVVEFMLQSPGLPDKKYWLIMRPDCETDLCTFDPQFDVDLYIVGDLRSLTAAWMGHSTYAAEQAKGTLQLIGDRKLAATLTDWLVRSPFADRDDDCGAVLVAQ